MTGAALAERLDVSLRTVYRDIADLTASGVPIAGEPGVGYLLRGYDLPPLMFTQDEVEALVFGARIVEAWADDELATAAHDALAKVRAVLPNDRAQAARRTALYAPRDDNRFDKPPELAALRRAIRDRRRIRFAYVDAHGASTSRTVQPLGMYFFGPVWLVASWCELREDFRAFRPDRMNDLDVLDDRFESVPGRTLDDFMCGVARQDAAEGNDTD